MRAGRLTAVGAALGAFAATGLLMAAPASASSDPVASCRNLTFNGQCLVLYYNSGLGGSSLTYEGTTSVADMAGDKFLTSGSGQGQYVKNNAASAKNMTSQGFWVSIYFNSYQDGPCDTIAPNKSTSQLRNTYNENASAHSGKGSGCYVFN